jgi:CheY-like chemotaxis protein/anti-sigma regulatory factor (Ser/Thr protein kinase)
MVGLLREQTLGPGLKRMVLRIDEAVASMENLLGGLLDLSRLEAGTVQPEIRCVALQDIFNAIASHEQEAALRKGLTLRFRPTPLTTESDPVLLEQIIRNLVSNAVKHTRHGKVLVTARRIQGQIRLEVRDTGAGIPIEHQERIFHEFVQIPTLSPGSDLSNRLESGLGLGLAIVRRISGLLGHTLSLRSEPGRGSCFRIDLPESTQIPRVEAEPSGETHPLRGINIALVEDDDAVRESLIERLQRWGMRVRAFGGQTEFRKALTSTGLATELDLLISDYRLDDGNGFDTALAVRKLRPGLPVLIITGDTSREDLTRLAESGLPVLHKPFRTEVLLRVLRQLLETRGSPPSA